MKFTDMRFCLTTLIFLSAFVMQAQAGIDFSATNGDRELEGMHFPQLIFHQNGHEITYEKPRDWTFSSDPSGMRLAPPNVSQAQVTVGQIPLTTPQAFDDTTTKQLQQFILSSAPPNAQNVALIAEEKNPLQIHGQPTYAVTIGYNYFGQDFESCVLFANLGDTQVRFRTTARKADFDKVHRAFRGSLFSLSWK
ncbi:MAG TPA: hypothetical protein VHW03_07285 [Chthoniobacterales bacterium]|nr:hypothetical protein [Chthoniobacterales bacterium]